MGREIKRIHIEWDWFERKGHDTWEGYLLDEITCPLCEGSGKDHTGKKKCIQCYGEGKDNPQIEPMKGWGEESGYQVWQDVSEGGPVSPVFLKPEDLAKWMVENDSSITRDTSYEAWLAMIKEEGSAPSMIGGPGIGLKSGTSVLYEGKENGNNRR